MIISDFQEQGKAAFNFQASKRALQDRIEQRLVITYQYKDNSGMFKASPELMSFLSLWDDKELVVRDMYDTPILVDKEELLFNLKMAYRAATNAWYLEYHELKKIRKVNDV